MNSDQAKEILKQWGKIVIGLGIILLFTFAIEKCDSNQTNSSGYEWEEEDFDMQPVQRP
jgi:hypothetical protein